MGDEVRACPFCGGETLNAEGSAVLCIKCGASGPYSPGRSRRPRIAAWNRRADALATPASEEVVERVARALIESAEPKRDFRLNPHYSEQLAEYRPIATRFLAAIRALSPTTGATA